MSAEEAFETSAFPVTLALPVLWGDMDALGHVNNTQYFRWFESARIACFERLGFDFAQSVYPVIVTTTCDFKKPVTYPASIRVGARFARMGRTSITMQYAVWEEPYAGGPPNALGSSVAVLVDGNTQQKIEVPDAIRRAAERLSAGPKRPPVTG